MLDSSSIELVPQSYVQPLDFVAAFDQSKPGAPLEIDVGSGDGAFLLALARLHPERNFLGIERLLGRVRKTCRRAARLGLSNVRMLRIESSYAVRRLLPQNSVARFHILFPDPWPKRRHWPRRLIQSDFLDAVSDALATGGELRIKTDDAPYFQHIRAVLKTRSDFREMPWPDETDAAENYPQTAFERGFVARGLPIHRVRLVKI